jgi:hypothetical protein
MRSVLILGARAPVALDHARRFSQQGWRVHVGDSISCELSARSRAVSGQVALPSPRYHGFEFSRVLGDYVHKHRIDLLVPTCEEVFFVARYRERLPAFLHIPVAPFDVLRRLHSKIDLLHEAQASGFDVPESHAVQTLEEARVWARGRACVIKPEFSRFGVFVRLYARGIPADAPPLESQGRWVVQSFCEGTELCSYSIASQGRLLAHQTYRPAYRLGRSSSYYFAPVLAPQIEANVHALVARLQFTGQISFDWMRDATGRCRVLECNPRATSGLHLFDMRDPIPAALTGEQTSLVRSSATSPRMLTAVMATSGPLQALRQRRWRQWCSDFADAGDVLSVAGDRGPLVGGLVDLLAYARLAFKARSTLREAATQDIEWDGQPI